VTAAAARLASELAAIVGRDHVLTDPGLKHAYEHDLTGRFEGESLLVVRPADAAQAAAALTACALAGAAVVPQGGHTGLVGGGTPRDGEVVLSLARLQALEAVDRASAQVTAGAGVTLERLQQHARSHGLDFPIDHGARSSATIGGMIATNAGGPLAYRYGTMRSLTAGLEAVVPDGRVVDRLSGLLKDNAGLGLPGLLVGSEGILAVVTRARLRLVPARRRRATALFAVESMEGALGVLDRLRTAAPSLEALDYFEAAGLAHVCARLAIEPPFDRSYPVYLVAECAGESDTSEELLAAVDLVADSALAVDEPGRVALWRYRELHNETIRSLGVPLKVDVSVPIDAIPGFEVRLNALVEDHAPGSELILYGHLGDGNVHVNVLGAGDRSEQLEEQVLRLTAELGGSISAEHGVGLAKAHWLELSRSPGEISLMRGVKRAFDPGGVLSPGRVLEEPV
jgi:FAD/FMN-containing dehydrogenase